MGSRQEIREITVDAVVENIGKVTEFVNRQLEEFACPVRVQTQIDIAIDELLGNIACYAYYPGTGTATILSEVKEGSRTVILTFMDRGIPFNPLVWQDPDIKLSLLERPEGGLGIYIVKQSMDEMSYEYKEGQNILKIKKKF